MENMNTAIFSTYDSLHQKHIQIIHNILSRCTFWCVRSILCSVSGSSNERNQLRMTIIQSYFQCITVIIVLTFCFALYASQRHATGQTKQMKKSNTGEISDIVNIPMQQEQRI